MIDQEQKRELRRIRCSVEHRLAAERAAGIDSVKSTNQRTILVPCFDTVRDPGFVKLRVRTHEILRYPCPGLVRPPHAGAGPDHFSKFFVDRERVRILSARTLQTARDMKLGEFEDRALLRAVPGKR